MISILKRYWPQFLFFSLAVACEGAMDYFNFQVPHDSGFWSLHTEGCRVDAWHSLKILKWTFIALGMVPRFKALLLFALINYAVHEFVYKTLKRTK